MVAVSLYRRHQLTEVEEWREIRGFPEYLISNYGRVYSIRSDIIMKSRPSGWGYLQVILSDNGRMYTKSIHIMVAEAFVPGWEEGLEPNHIDGDKSNNQDINLEWETKRGNNIHAIRTGLRAPRATAVVIVETGERFRTVNDCAEHLGVTGSAVSAVLNGRSMSCQGYHIKYG